MTHGHMKAFMSSLYQCTSGVLCLNSLPCVYMKTNPWRNIDIFKHFLWSEYVLSWLG